MTEAEALEILKKYDVYPGYRTMGLYLRERGDVLGELIGEIDSNFVFIVKYLPSAIGETYSDVSKTPVAYDAPRARIVLETLLRDLHTSAQRWEEDQRQQRTRNVHQYFLKRNMKIKILPEGAEIPDPPDEGTLYLR